jgi:hypothetical protein
MGILLTLEEYNINVLLRYIFHTETKQELKAQLQTFFQVTYKSMALQQTGETYQFTGQSRRSSYKAEYQETN